MEYNSFKDAICFYEKKYYTHNRHSTITDFGRHCTQTNRN